MENNKDLGQCGDCEVFKKKSPDGEYLHNCPVLVKSGDENVAVNKVDSACNDRVRKEYEKKMGEKKKKGIKIFPGMKINLG